MECTCLENFIVLSISLDLFDNDNKHVRPAGLCENVHTDTKGWEPESLKSLFCCRVVRQRPGARNQPPDY